MADIGRSVEGYLFLSEEDAALAREEVDRINYISSRMSANNPNAILAVYDRMVQNRTFVTPVGQEYLGTLRDYLYKSPQIDDSLIKDVPVVVSYTEALKSEKEKEKEKKAERRKVKTFKREYQVALGVIGALIFVIISMFTIALRSDNPNIINYENAIVDKYAGWEQELTERESKIREKEEELGIDPLTDKEDTSKPGTQPEIDIETGAGD
ncbi:MAG: hypothetical protein K5886_07345 [Lachnospiraceae bacterium]|nr:hypothetical protein [Lachnospiraceae bacterium]